VRIKLGQFSEDVLSISSRGGKDLVLQGTVEAVNGALDSLLYTGY
jgi:hypothetical protein